MNLVSYLGGFEVCEDMRGCCPLHSEHISGMQAALRDKDIVFSQLHSQYFDISFFLSIIIKPN